MDFSSLITHRPPPDERPVAQAAHVIEAHDGDDRTASPSIAHAAIFLSDMRLDGESFKSSPEALRTYDAVSDGLRRRRSYAELEKIAQEYDRDLHHINASLSELLERRNAATRSAHVSGLTPTAFKAGDSLAGHWTTAEFGALERRKKKILESHAHVYAQLLSKSKRYGPASQSASAKLGRSAALRMLKKESGELGLSESATQWLARHTDVVIEAFKNKRLLPSSRLRELAHHARPAPLPISRKSGDEASADNGRAAEAGKISATNGASRTCESYTYKRPNDHREGFFVLYEDVNPDATSLRA